ncbi:MAG: hypothetical protein ACFFCO_12515 [Promethearchaeota archaeon]
MPKPPKEDIEELSISELIQGDPAPPLLEPALALLGCILVVSANFLSQSVMTSIVELLPESLHPFFLDMLVSLFFVGIGSALMLLISSAVMYFYHLKAGGVLSIISGIISFFELGVMLWGTYGSILGILAGALALRSRKPPEPGSRSEIL